MAQVELAVAAVQDLQRLIAVMSLPGNTTTRVRQALLPLQDFPRLGPELTGRWRPLRFLLGPWRWMLLIYSYDEDTDRVVVVTIQDARSEVAATSSLEL